MKNKFEELINLIVNEEEDKARELFHSLVVEKSREIYNDLVSEDEDEDEDDMDESLLPEMGDATDDMMNDIDADEMGMDNDQDEYEDEDEDDDMMGDEDDDMMGDEDDDMMGDEDDDMMGDEDDDMMGDEGIEDRVVDLEDALDELKAEFERLMGDEDGEEEEMPDDMVREYTEKVSVTHSDGTDSKGSKSPVAGKNDMGGTAKNLVQSGEEKGGSTPKSGDMGAVDPRAAGKTAFKKKAVSPVSKDQATGTRSPVAKG
jgi:hypothetical protein